MGSIKWKMATLYMALVVTVMISSGVFILFTLQNNSYREVFRQNEYTAERIVDIFGMQTLSEEDTPQKVFGTILTPLMIENINTSAGGDDTKDIYLLSDRGDLIYSRDPDITTADLSSRALIDVQSGQTMKKIYVHKLTDGNTVGDYALSFMLPQNKQSYIIFIRQSMTSVENNISRLTADILITTMIGITIAGVLALLMARSVSRPIVELSDRTKQLAAGELVVEPETGEGAGTEDASKKGKGKRVSLKERSTHDELDQLELNFNDMAVELTTSINELKAMEQMQKEFVANVSHELRTPITTIKSYVDTLLDSDLEDKEMSRRFLTVVSHESDRMTALITDLLELSRMDAGQIEKKKEPIEMGRLMLTCLNDLEWDAGKKGQDIEWAQDVRLKDTNSDPDSLKEPYGQYWILGDPRRIEQVIRNLLTNAIKYSGEDTMIYGGIYRRVRQDGIAEVWLKVQDQGIGIAPEDQKHLFERFYRVDKARSRSMGGTGLGLAIAKETTEMYGGRIWVESKLGEGSTFWTAFPLTDPPQDTDTDGGEDSGSSLGYEGQEAGKEEAGHDER